MFKRLRQLWEADNLHQETTLMLGLGAGGAVLTCVCVSLASSSGWAPWAVVLLGSLLVGLSWPAGFLLFMLMNTPVHLTEEDRAAMAREPRWLRLPLELCIGSVVGLLLPVMSLAMLGAYLAVKLSYRYRLRLRNGGPRILSHPGLSH